MLIIHTNLTEGIMKMITMMFMFHDTDDRHHENDE